MEEAEGKGGERGHAKGPPGRGRRAGPSEGRAEAAPRRAHTRTHALPLHPPAAPRPRGRAAAAGNGATCWRLSATARAPSALALFSPSARAPPARPRRRLQARAAPGIATAGARAASWPFFPHPRDEKKKKCGSGCRPGLGGKASFFSFSSPWLLPAPAQLRGLEPLGSPPRGSAARAPEGVTASRQSRRGGPRPPTAELREVCHSSRGATGWHGNGAAEPWPLSGQDGRHALGVGGGLGRGREGRAEGQRIHTVSPGGDSRAARSPTPASSGRPRLQPPPLPPPPLRARSLATGRSCKAEPTLPRAPIVPHPLPRV